MKLPIKSFHLLPLLSLFLLLDHLISIFTRLFFIEVSFDVPYAFGLNVVTKNDLSAFLGSHSLHIHYRFFVFIDDALQAQAPKVWNRCINPFC